MQDRMPDQLRALAGSDIMQPREPGDWQEAKACEWAQKLVMDAADRLERLLRQHGDQPKTNYSAAERAAYGQLMREKRARQERNAPSGDHPQGQRTHKAHLYPGQAALLIPAISILRIEAGKGAWHAS